MPASKASRLCLADAPPATFPALLECWVRRYGERVFLPRRQARVEEPITYQRLVADVERLAAGLADLGIRRGDRVGLLADNRYEWMLADLGITYLGAVDVPRGADTAPSEIEFILRHAGCKAAFVEDDHAAEALLQMQPRLPELRDIFVLAGHATVPGVAGLGDLLDRGRRWIESHPEGLADLAAQVQCDDMLTIVYTSGTTAEPKGVMLTHANVLSNIRNVCEVLHITGDDIFLSVLPAWHMYERIMDYLALAAGGSLVYTDRRHIKEDLQQVRPTVFAAVPRIWESIYDGIVAHAHKLPGLRGRVLRGVLGLCRRVGAGNANPLHSCLHALCRRTVLKKLQAISGGRLRLAVSGGGALPRHVDEGLLGIGFPLLNGYGLTETSPVAAVRRPERNRPGTIGPPIPETEIQARDREGNPLPAGKTGVLWIRGPQVMKGYYHNPEKTAQVLDAEGWFCSGDLGHVDELGEWWITGRAKDTIVLAGGENVEPEPLETAIKTSPYIEQAVVVGQDQKALGAFLVPAVECLQKAVPRRQWDERGGLLHGKAVHDLMRAELDRLLSRKNGFRPVDRVSCFRVLLEPMTPENGFLTQTLKVRRHVVHERLGPLIEDMFRR